LGGVDAGIFGGKRAKILDQIGLFLLGPAKTGGPACRIRLEPMLIF
jgi:hypothetical protein